MNIEEIKKIAKGIDGFLADDEGQLLFSFAKNCQKKGVIVEIGSWKGTSTIWIGAGSKEGNKTKIYAIDPHTGSLNENAGLIENQKSLTTFEEFQKNIKSANVDDIVLPIVKTSEQAVKDFNEPVEFIFIDGDHKYESAKLDFDLWFPKVINGGIMAFHDSVGSGFPGPRRVVKDLVYKSKHFKNMGTVNSITFATKTEKNSLKDRIKNRYKLFSKDFYIFAGNLSLPKPIKTIGKKIANKLLNYKYGSK